MQQLQDLQDGVDIPPGNSEKALKEALHQISAALIRPATWDLPFGSNVYGIYGATPPEMLHQYDLGLLRTTWECKFTTQKQILVQFVV